MFTCVSIAEVQDKLPKSRDWAQVLCNNSKELALIAMVKERSYIQLATFAMEPSKSKT
jgi:hypothetical protein